MANIKFDKQLYLNEMRQLVDQAFEEMQTQHADFEVFTASIWTDPNAAASSINFDSKENSDKQNEESNAWSKKHYDAYMEAGNVEQAAFFAPRFDRNCNPADSLLRDFAECNNASIPLNWEEKTKGKCWNALEPLLKEVGEYAFGKVKQLKIAADFELSVNSREDWYAVTWNVPPQ
jgi:hypothetical protein